MTRLLQCCRTPLQELQLDQTGTSRRQLQYKLETNFLTWRRGSFSLYFSLYFKFIHVYVSSE